MLNQTTEGKFIVRRQIGIDAGHRVMTHGSKCRNMHGHRYTIEAHCQTGQMSGNDRCYHRRRR